MARGIRGAALARWVAAWQGSAQRRSSRGRSRLGTPAELGAARDSDACGSQGRFRPPYLGVIGKVPARTLAAEPERSSDGCRLRHVPGVERVRSAVAARPRRASVGAFQRSATSTTRPRHTGEASRSRLGIRPIRRIARARVHAARPGSHLGGPIRAGEALASAAHPDSSNARTSFGQGARASMLAPLLPRGRHRRGEHERARCARWTPGTSPVRSVLLKRAGAAAAADQLEGVSRRDERNRETTVMSRIEPCALIATRRLPVARPGTLRRAVSSMGRPTRSMSSLPATTRTRFAP